MSSSKFGQTKDGNKVTRSEDSDIDVKTLKRNTDLETAKTYQLFEWIFYYF